MKEYGNKIMEMKVKERNKVKEGRREGNKKRKGKGNGRKRKST